MIDPAEEIEAWYIDAQAAAITKPEAIERDIRILLGIIAELRSRK